MKGTLMIYFRLEAEKVAYWWARHLRFFDVVSILAIAAGMNVFTSLIPLVKINVLRTSWHIVCEFCLALALCTGGVLTSILDSGLREKMEIVEDLKLRFNRVASEQKTDFNGAVEQDISKIWRDCLAVCLTLIASIVLLLALLLGGI
jgi:hypothetical protein